MKFSYVFSVFITIAFFGAVSDQCLGSSRQSRGGANSLVPGDSGLGQNDDQPSQGYGQTVNPNYPVEENGGGYTFWPLEAFDWPLTAHLPTGDEDLDHDFD